MPDRSRVKTTLLRLAPVLGVALLGYLLTTVKLGALRINARAIGWGMLLVIALGGVSHVVKSWAWRLTLSREGRHVSFARLLGLRLISEAIGQLGFIGMLGGEAARVSMLGSGVSVAGAISSVALDRSLFILTGALITIAGTTGVLLVVSVSHAAHCYAVALVIGLLTLLSVGAIAMQRRWRLFSGPALVAARIPCCRKWVERKRPTFEAAETRITDFYHESSRLFWCSVGLNLLCHLLAIVEVYLILRMLGAPATLLGALILESLTKLINVAGSLNPGNVGTYEGGTMVIGRLVRMTGTQGLLLALCRRFRAVFWAIVGGICLLWFTRKRRTAPTGGVRESEPGTTASMDQSEPPLFESRAVFILANELSQDEQRGAFEPVWARVATLPILLRNILSAQCESTVRTVLVLNSKSGPEAARQLIASGRLPAGTEWLEVHARTTLPEILSLADIKADRFEFIRGNCSYRPTLFRTLRDWDGEAGAVEFVSSGAPIGLVALNRDMAQRLAQQRDKEIVDNTDLHHWLSEDVTAARGVHQEIEVDQESWQVIAQPEDVQEAERKLDRWLVKPTDGIFARMNRSVSIPISRRLLKYPITPNMISLFTLALSLVGAALFAAGGYLNCVAGAILGVWGSILDGCDGEIARLKLQASVFGCWLDTICDYTYYFVTFAAIIVGVARSSGDPRITGLGLAILAGALLTFISASVGRKRMSGDRPEQYLQVWQKHAESRSAGLLLKMARQTEFIVRRCFLPYFLLMLAILDQMHALVYMMAFGANVAWMISLRSVLRFPGNGSASGERVGSVAPDHKPAVAKA